MKSSLFAKLLLAIAAAAIALFTIEGVLSLGFSKSLRPNALESIVTYGPPGGGANDRSRVSNSYMRFHPNPRIGIEVIPDEIVRVVDRDTRVRPDGLRNRVGPEAGPNALRVVILGDSVAFGVRLGDDETIASHLESILDRARDPNGRDVVCETLAAPGWSGRNATAALLDRLPDLRPDVVVFLPIDNDLCDTLGIGDGGAISPSFDVLSPQPLLRAGFETVFARIVHLANAWRAGAPIDAIRGDELGKILLNHGTTASSRSRYDAERAAIRKLDRALRENAARLYVQFYLEAATEPIFAPVMRQHLREGIANDRRIPEIAGFAAKDAAFTLENDMHPSSRGARALAALIARRLVADGVVSLATGATLEGVEPELVRFVARIPDDAALDAAVERMRAEIASAASSRVVPENGRGCLQVFGGLNPDATLGPDFVCGLRRAGDRLRIVVAPIDPPPPGPVELTVSIDDRPLGTLSVPPAAGAPIEASFPLGATNSIFEVRLLASDWWTRYGANKRLVSSVRLVELAAD